MVHTFALLEVHSQILVWKYVFARVGVDDVLNDVVLVTSLLVVGDHQLGV